MNSALFEFGLMTVVWSTLNATCTDVSTGLKTHFEPDEDLVKAFGKEVIEYGNLPYANPAEWIGCHFHVHSCAEPCSLEQTDEEEGAEMNVVLENMDAGRACAPWGFVTS